MQGMKVRGCVQGMKVRGLCAADEGEGAVCRE